MVSFLEGKMAATIGAAFKNVFMDGTLERDTFTGHPTEPVKGTPLTFKCKAIHEEWSAGYLAGGLVQANERKVMILATSLATTPMAGDRVTVRGETFTVVDGVNAVSTDPAKAVWTLRARA